MSGILGIIKKNINHPVDQSILETGINSIKYHDIGFTHFRTFKNIGVGIYDQFGDGSERFIYENDRILVICDAEIYHSENIIDFDEQTPSFSEAKIIADLYLKYEEKWWENIEGVYGVFIWDKINEKGLVYTDRIGIKPIVYYEDNDQMIISSRIRCISKLPFFEKQLDRQAIFTFLFVEMIPTPYTIYSNIRKLESGYYIQIQHNRMDIKLAWKMEYPVQKLNNLEELCPQIYQLTKDSVKLQLNYRSEVKQVGCFLSGGTDSSTIAGLINELHPGLSQTFSIGFNESGYDEMHYARIAARHFNTIHHEYYVTPQDIFEMLPQLVALYDEPFANSSVIPAYFCAKLARENGVEVLLGGDGGDEIFGGNARYYDNFANFSQLPAWLVNFSWIIVNSSPEIIKKVGLKKIYNYIKRARSPLHERIHAYSLQNYHDINEIFNADFLNNSHFLLPEEISKKYIEQAGTDDFLDQFLYNDLKLTLMDNDLRKVGLTAELANINVRYPFLGHKIVEFTGKIPATYKVKGDQLRYIFKQTFRNLLPQEIINKKKHGFGLPIVPWMMRPGKLHNLVKDLIYSSSLSDRKIFNDEFIRKIYKKAMEDTTTFYGSFIYFVVFLELWLQTYFDE
jgi:asparagine synthase (glutamine-hydrolysing)